MTRITNIGRKRTYLEAGFDKPGEAIPHERGDEPDLAIEDVLSQSNKPHKRRKKGKAPEIQREEATSRQCMQDQHDEVRPNYEGKPTKTEGQVATQKHAIDKAAASERRRLKRISGRHANTICLACRKQGHAVKDCPNARTTVHEDDAGITGAPGKSVVGICYRCGSTRHNLSRCKKPADPTRPLPFASCFVCSGRGHLASSCPKNQGRGIYPNGGSCKLCGQTSHLAKDCELRKQEQASKSTVMLGDTQTEGGADEDDFHVLKRRRDAVDRDEKIHQRVMRHPDIMSGKTKPKVVVFR